MKVTIEITEQEIKDLKLIRNYFVEHDVTMLEHLAYNELDKLVKKLTIPDVVKPKGTVCNASIDTECMDSMNNGFCDRCGRIL